MFVNKETTYLLTYFKTARLIGCRKVYFFSVSVIYIGIEMRVTLPGSILQSVDAFKKRIDYFF